MHLIFLAEIHSGARIWAAFGHATQHLCIKIPDLTNIGAHPPLSDMLNRFQNLKGIGFV
jgi:hypothetical protein